MQINRPQSARQCVPAIMLLVAAFILVQIQAQASVRSASSSRAISIPVAVTAVPVTEDAPPGYHDYKELLARLKRIADEHGDIARLVSTGKTLGGRDVWVMELGTQTGTPQDQRPALLITANLEGNQLIGSELAMGVVQYLVDGYENDEQIKARLENYMFYVFPRINPDGAEKAFQSIQAGSTTNTRPFDDDNDGRTDEDGPEDLDRNGVITVMRVPDPSGKYMIDPDDDRLMKEADPQKGESGSFALYVEGIDNDGDGFFNEDPSGGVNLNRNFQHEYPYYNQGAGPHMVSENESRAVMDYIVSHRNISLMLSFGDHDNLITAPNKKGELAKPRPINLFSFAQLSNDEANKVGIIRAPQRRSFRRRSEQAQTSNRPSGRHPETTINKDDREYFSKISTRYREITGIKKQPATHKPAGTLFEYGYYQFGVPSFSTPGWGFGVPTAEKEDSTDAAAKTKGETGKARGDGAAAARTKGDASSEKSDKSSLTVDEELARFQDANGTDGQVSWTPYEHPTLGAVEIGGFKPFEAVNPPGNKIPDLIQSHGEFVVYLSSLFADVKIAKTEVVDHGGGIFRIKAEVENSGFLPTASTHGVVSRSVKPTMVQLDIPPESLVSGAPKTSFFQSLPGSGGRKKFEWIITGKRGDHIELRVVSQKGGSDSTEVILQ